MASITHFARKPSAVVTAALLVVASSAVSLALAQPQKPTTSDDAARQVAAAVQSFYDQTKDVSASFFQTYVNKLYDRKDRSKGHVVFKKPGKMRWDYEKPNGKVIIAASGKLLVYEPGEAGEKGQVLEQGLSDAELPAAMAFLMGEGRLVDDFTFRLLDAAAEGYPTGQVLELLPRKPNPHFERLIFYVETAPARRGLVRRLLIIDAGGNRNRFDFSGFKFNSAVPETTFSWKPPADTRHVHL